MRAVHGHPGTTWCKAWQGSRATRGFRKPSLDAQWKGYPLVLTVEALREKTRSMRAMWLSALPEGQGNVRRSALCGDG